MDRKEKDNQNGKDEKEADDSDDDFRGSGHKTHMIMIVESALSWLSCTVRFGNSLKLLEDDVEE